MESWVQRQASWERRWRDWLFRDGCGGRARRDAPGRALVNRLGKRRQVLECIVVREGLVSQPPSGWLGVIVPLGDLRDIGDVFTLWVVLGMPHCSGCGWQTDMHGRFWPVAEALWGRSLAADDIGRLLSRNQRSSAVVCSRSRLVAHRGQSSKFLGVDDRGRRRPAGERLPPLF